MIFILHDNFADDKKNLLWFWVGSHTKYDELVKS